MCSVLEELGNGTFSFCKLNIFGVNVVKRCKMNRRVKK